MPGALLYGVVFRTSSGDVTLTQPWARALLLVFAAETVASVVLIYCLSTGSLCPCTGPSVSLSSSVTSAAHPLTDTPLHTLSAEAHLSPTAPAAGNPPRDKDAELQSPRPVFDYDIDELVPEAYVAQGDVSLSTATGDGGTSAAPRQDETTGTAGGKLNTGSHSMNEDTSTALPKGKPRGSAFASAQGVAGGAGHSFARDRARPAVSQTPHLYGLSQKLLPPGFVPFGTLLNESRSDKKIHNFGHMYAEYVDALRLQQPCVNMLEIGLRDGDSLNLWSSAFPVGKIYGLEYNPNPLSHAAPSAMMGGRVRVFQGDQANETLLGEIVAEVREDVGPLDLIVDDGGHSMQQQITSFTHLFPLVRPGGVYFIEDLQTSYWRNKCYHHWDMKTYCYGGGKPWKKNTTVHLMKSLIDVLNSDFIQDHKDVNKLGSGVHSVNPSDHLVGSLQCWRNMCAIRRKINEHF